MMIKKRPARVCLEMWCSKNVSKLDMLYYKNKPLFFVQFLYGANVHKESMDIVHIHEKYCIYNYENYSKQIDKFSLKQKILKREIEQIYKIEFSMLNFKWNHIFLTQSLSIVLPVCLCLQVSHAQFNPRRPW